MNDKSFVQHSDTDEESADLPLPQKRSSDSSETSFLNVFFTIVFIIVVIILFTTTRLPYGYMHLSAHNDAELSEVASNYGIKHLDEQVAEQFPGLDGDVRFLSIQKEYDDPVGFGDPYSTYEISYRHGDQTYDFEVSLNNRYFHFRNRATAWIDMSEPEDIHVYLEDSEDSEHKILRKYSKTIKRIFDESTHLVVEHITDRMRWRDTFTQQEDSQ